MIEFVYNGQVNVTQAQLSSFLKTAEMLQVRGLTGDDEKVIYGARKISNLIIPSYVILRRLSVDAVAGHWIKFDLSLYVLFYIQPQHLVSRRQSSVMMGSIIFGIAI